MPGLDKRLSLPFDQHQRYRIVADAIERLREGPDPLRVLDVGGGDGIVLNFLPEDRITILDRLDTREVPGFVEGDATALPFEDEAFDYVLSVDVHDHIRPEAREKHLSELRRTAKRGVLLAAPFNSATVRGAERVANEFHRAVHLQDNVWLREHAENGLPELDDAREFFERQDDTVLVLPNGYIPHWLAMMCLTFHSSNLEGAMGDVFEHANVFYNESIYELDNAEPCYRHLLVCLREPVNVSLDELTSPDPGPERAARSSSLFGMLSAMLPVATDAQRLEAREEGALAHKEAQVNDLSRRLAEQIGVANTLHVLQSTLRQENADLREQRDDLRRQRDQLERQRDDLRRQLAGVTGSLTWRLLSAQRTFRIRVGQTLRSRR